MMLFVLIFICNIHYCFSKPFLQQFFQKNVLKNVVVDRTSLLQIINDSQSFANRKKMQQEIENFRIKADENEAFLRQKIKPGSWRTVL